jgi:hypothetical protein
MEFDFAQRVLRLCKKSKRDNFLNDLRYARSLNKVVEWCRSKGVTVQLHTASCGQYVPEDKTIFITQRARPEYQLHVLLHECGHLLIDKHDKNDRFKRERDAAVEEIPKVCYYCKHRKGWKTCDRFNGNSEAETCSNWKWRGIKED